MGIAENITAVRERIVRAAKRAGRDPASVRLVGVVKGMTPATIEAALAAGLVDLGENYVQEAMGHRAEVAAATTATWHGIGHLQTNKVGDALRLFDILQAVDSVRLAGQISRQATRPVRLLLEVNVAGEASKDGFAPADVAAAVSSVCRLPNLELAGLMTIAPAADDPELARPVFRELAALAQAHGLQELSMGMTDDFEVAIAEGATMVRIGRAIFGARP